MPPVASRRSYTIGFKLEVVTYAEENGGNMAAQRKYGISEKVVRGWRKQKDILGQMKKTKKALRSGNKPRWPELEDRLESFVLEKRAEGIALSAEQILLKAVEIAKTLNIQDFTGNPTWCFRFRKRKNLCLRKCKYKYKVFQNGVKFEEEDKILL